MGSIQSKPAAEAAPHDKALMDRLQVIKFDSRRENAEHADDDKQFNEKALALRSTRTPEGISVELMTQWQELLLADPKNRLALSALISADLREVLVNRATKITDQQVFNIQIPFEGAPVTNQRSSGRCWLFAATNVFRVALMQKYNLDAFELSQAYLFFWDKLEKANWFLEQVISTADADLDSRLVQMLLQVPLSDGGQWDMLYNLVAKYGLVPHVLYPDSFHASHSSTINRIVFTKLREGALALRTLLRDQTMSVTTSALAQAKARILKDIHAVLTVTLGPPPAVDGAFTWEFTDKAGKSHTVRATPTAFARDIYPAEGSGPASRVGLLSTVACMVSLVHDPRHPPFQLLSVDRLGNVVGGRAITYVNVPMATLKQACVAMLRAGRPVFFGSDVGQFSNSKTGIMDLDLFDYELGLGLSLRRMDKAQRLRTGESAMTHAMVLTAVHVDDAATKGEPVRWRVQNSWGVDAGDHGFFVMSDRWMDEFVYQAVVDPRFLSTQVTDVLKQNPIVLPLWDPLGSLA